MPYRVSYLEDDGIVFTEYTPPMRPDEYTEIISTNMALAAEKDSLLFLGDCRALPRDSAILDVYELGALFDRLGIDRRMREALVVSSDPGFDQNFEFFVTVTGNRGFQIRLFASMDEATDWLKQDRSTL